MKSADKDKPIDTTPKGAWEGGIASFVNHAPMHRNPNEITTDSQGNGYPVTQGTPTAKPSV